MEVEDIDFANMKYKFTKLILLYIPVVCLQFLTTFESTYAKINMQSYNNNNK